MLLNTGDVIYRLNHRFSSGHVDNRYFFVAGTFDVLANRKYILLTCTTSEASFPGAKSQIGCTHSSEHNYACFYSPSSTARFPKDTYINLLNIDSSTVFLVSDLDAEVSPQKTNVKFKFSPAETKDVMACASGSPYLPGRAIKSIKGSIAYYNTYQSWP